LQTSKKPSLPLLHEDERRAELLVDVVATVLVFVHPVGTLATHRDRRLPIGTHLYLLQPEGFVPQVRDLVAGEPLLLGQREPSRSYADEVVSQDAPKEGGISAQLGWGPLPREFLHLAYGVVHDVSPTLRFARLSQATFGMASC